MKKIFTFFLSFMLLMSIGVKAQFSATVTDIPRTNWTEGVEVTFPLDEICAQLGCTVDQLFDALDEWTENANGNSNGYAMTGLFTLEGSNVEATFYSEQWGGFEMDKDGNFSSWTNPASVWGVYIIPDSWNVETNTISFTVCQVPANPLGKDVVCHGVVALNLYGGKATFEFTFSVEVGEGIDKTPETDLSKLEIVGETTYEMVQEPKTADQEWNSTYYYINIDGAADAIGIDHEYLARMLKEVAHAKTFDSETESWGALTSKGSAVPAPGFYFCGGVQFEGDEEESKECRNGDYQDNNKFWVCGMQFVDDENGEWIYCGVGQTLNAIPAGQTRYGDIYLVYGNKAYIIHLVLSIPDVTPITDLVKVGEQTWTVANRDPRKTWNELEWCDLNLDSIAALFSQQMGKDVTAADFVLTGTNNAGGTTSEYTADNSDENHVHGFWLSGTGIVDVYGSNASCIYVNYYDNDSILGLGNKPSYFKGGEQVVGSVYFVVDGTHYYEVKVDMTVMMPEYTFEDCEIIDYDFTVQLVPSAEGGAWEIGTTFMQDAEMTLGAAGILYGVTADGSVTTAYSVSEANDGATGGGFWMSPEDENHYAYADWYSGEGAFALWYYESMIHWFVVPGFRHPGETTTAVFYIVDLWNGKALRLNTTLKFVDHIVEIKAVGEEDVVLKGRNMSGDDLDEVELNLAACCEKLGCTEDELVTEGVWYALDASGNLTNENIDEMYGFGFDAQGNAIAQLEEATFTVGFFPLDGVVRSYISDEENVNNVYHTILYVLFRERLYAFNITIGDESSAVNGIEADSSLDGAIYDLAGRIVKNPSKGIYIQNGKKVMVK